MTHLDLCQPRTRASDIDFSCFNSPRPTAECVHGVAYRLDRLTTGPPCLACITLSPRCLPISDMILGLTARLIPLIDFDFE